MASGLFAHKHVSQLKCSRHTFTELSENNHQKDYDGKKKQQAKKKNYITGNVRDCWLTLQERDSTHPRTQTHAHTRTQTHIHTLTSVARKRIPVWIYGVGSQMTQLQYVIFTNLTFFLFARHSCRFVPSTRFNKLDRSTWAFQTIHYRNRCERMYRKHTTIINTVKTTGTLPNHRKHAPFF